MEEKEQYEVEVESFDPLPIPVPQVINTTSNNLDFQYTWPTTSTWYSYPTTIYMYQIRCPKVRCKTYNWLQLDTIKPCSKCGSTLKAVSRRADFEVEVN